MSVGYCRALDHQQAQLHFQQQYDILSVGYCITLYHQWGTRAISINTFLAKYPCFSFSPGCLSWSREQFGVNGHAKKVHFPPYILHNLAFLATTHVTSMTDGKKGGGILQNTLHSAGSLPDRCKWDGWEGLFAIFYATAKLVIKSTKTHAHYLNTHVSFALGHALHSSSINLVIIFGD